MNVVIVAANSSAGKTEFIRLLDYELADSGVQMGYMTDRLGLQGHVIADSSYFFSPSVAQQIHQSEEHTQWLGGHEVTVSNFIDSPNAIHGSGAHSDFAANHLIIEGEPGTDPFSRMVIHLHDGTTLNETHESMIGGIAAFAERLKGQKAVLIVEWAIGPDAFLHLQEQDSQLVLHQNASHLVRMLKDRSLLEDVLIVGIDSSFEIRAERNRRRGRDRMTDEEFAMLFPDGGELTADDIRIIEGNFIPFPNHGLDINEFNRNALTRIRERILPRIVEGTISRESSQPSRREREI